jgi:glycosyltransferase involved in cell wall biosynthesis
MEINRKIRVLLCSPYGTMVGGISRWTGHILNYYSKIETDISLKHFYSKGKGAYQNTNLFMRLYIGIISYPPFLIGLNSELKNNKYNVVHFTSSASISLIRDIFTLQIARKYGSKTIIHFHFGRIPNIFKKNNWEQKLLRKVINMSDKIIVLDKKSYDTLIAQGFSNIEILPNPISSEVNKIITSNSVIVRQKNKLLFAGHIVRTKGVFELIEACKDINNIELYMVGYTPEDIKKKLIISAGINSSKWLFFRGQISLEETIKEMISATVFVLPTYTEGFPYVIIESMACGCPIVTTKVGAIPEMLDIENGENYGLCVEPKNVEQLKNAILRMLNDRDFAKQCGVNAKKRVNELYSMPIVWNQMVQIWKSIIE